MLSCQVLLMGVLEAYRANQAGPACEDLDLLHFGEAFNPLGLINDPGTFAGPKVEEIENIRLEIFSMLGYYVEAIVTSSGPVENWVGQAVDSLGTNSLFLAMMGQFAPSPATMFYLLPALILTPAPVLAPFPATVPTPAPVPTPVQSAGSILAPVLPLVPAPARL